MAANKDTYRVKGPMMHDGQPYEDGDDIELTKAQADQALASKSVARIERAKAEAKEPAKK